MQRKDSSKCRECGVAAQFTLCMLVSTLGVSPRRQKCTKSVPICSACIQAFSVRLGKLPSGLVAPLNEAYTELDGYWKSASDCQS